MQQAERAVRSEVARLDRAVCAELLGQVGIAVYDHEGVRVLRAAVVANVLDGTISRQRLRTTGKV